jgi:hypothetical protein
MDMYTSYCMQHETMQLIVIPDDYMNSPTGWACIMMSDGNPPPDSLGDGWNITVTD